jgi:hypothetical protein
MRIELLLELIGYLGSALVIVSMLMTSVVKLRIINTVGSVIFCGYALAIHSYPTAAMQVCLVVINLVNLYKLNNTKKEYSAIALNASDCFLAHFLFAYNNDIKKYFPDFNGTDNEDKIFLITCEESPAGIFIAKDDGADQLTAKLDYTTPAYRDCSAGKFLYNHLKHLGVKKISAETKIPSHEKYLKKMGFKPKRITGDKNDSPNYYMHFEKSL